MSIESGQAKAALEQSMRDETVSDVAKASRVNESVVGIISVGGTVAGGLLAGSAVFGPLGAVLGGLIGAGAAYAAFHDLVKDKQPQTKKGENTDTPVGSH